MNKVIPNTDLFVNDLIDKRQPRSGLNFIFEGSLVTSGGKEQEQSVVLTAFRGLFHLLDTHTEAKQDAHILNKEAISSARQELEYIQYQISNYPWGLMVKGVITFLAGKEKESHALIRKAQKLGLDNLLAHMTMYLIEVRHKNRRGAEQSLTRIRKKESGNSPLVRYLESLSQAKDGLLCTKPVNPIVLLKELKGIYIKPEVVVKNHRDVVYDGLLDDGHHSKEVLQHLAGPIDLPFEDSPAYFAFNAYQKFIGTDINTDVDDEAYKALFDAPYEQVDKALSLNDRYAWGYFVRASIQVQQYRDADALADIQKAIDLGLINKYTLYLRSLLLYSVGEFSRAIQDIEDAMSKVNDVTTLASYHYLRIGILIQTGEKNFNRLIKTSK